MRSLPLVNHTPPHHPHTSILTFYMNIFFFTVTFGRQCLEQSLQIHIPRGGQALVDCARKKSILCFQQCSYFLEIMPKLCYFLKIMLSVTEIMLLRFYTDFKENKDHQQLNSINFDFNEHSYSPPSSLTVFSIANTHVRTSKSQMINK